MKDNSLYSYKGHNYLVPFVLITSLFFLWGFAHGILEVLNPHVQETFQVTKATAALVQAAVYGGYFLMALPAGWIIRRYGYRRGVVSGLLLYALGALLFIPGAYINSFYFFVFSLFVIGCGLTCLETSANPYATVLGDPRKAESRINLSQSFNGLGWIFGPLVGGQLLFSGASIALPYTIVGIVVLMVAMVFVRVPLPEIADAAEENVAESSASASTKMWNLSFVLGVVALFLYVAAQTGVNSFFINYMTEAADISKKTAANWLAFGGMGLFVIGRLSGSWMMSRVSPRRLLGVYALLASLATCFIVWGTGRMTMGAFFVVYLTESIMFPTIFSLALGQSGGHTKQASSILIMTIVGGAIAPVLMGHIADTTGSMALAFLIPLCCYLYIAAYSMKTPKSQDGV
ncbi:MAG: sugar MFS transporter [Bacteroidaceae bacterium]|nr:sugar MFS transporter [Bacteroidaceae bacterium]